jgi:prolipoprotein diacylglyceryltransferase
MPDRFLIYVAIIALSRMLIEIMSDTQNRHEEILLVAGGIVLLSLAVLILRLGSYKYCYGHEGDEKADVDEKNIFRKYRWLTLNNNSKYEFKCPLHVAFF